MKARKLVFTDPIRNLPTVNTRTTIPMPLDAAAIRAALDHPDPATALSVAIVAFHGLTNGQTRTIQLTDIIDGRLTLPDGRSIPLAEPVRVRLTAWLDYRAQRWPATINPHLFLTQQTAPRLSAPGDSFPWKKAGLNPRPPHLPRGDTSSVRVDSNGTTSAEVSLTSMACLSWMT